MRGGDRLPRSPTEWTGGEGDDSAEGAAILLIDDSITFREQLGAELRDAGYRTVLAASGEEGLSTAATTALDAVIVDGVMPGLDGVTVVRRLRLDPDLQTVPCLLLTASEGVETEIAALDAGADAYAHKSEGVDVVLAHLDAMLRAARASRASLQGVKSEECRRILAADDSMTYLESIGERLAEEGYEVIKARSGEEALERLGSTPVDCVLLDLEMPGMSGLETCRRIKESPVTYHLPVIILTSHEERASLIEGIHAGADEYIVKSADFGVIAAHVRAQLRRKRIEDGERRVRNELRRRGAEVESARRIAAARKELLEELERANAALAAHGDELERLNSELEMFAYSVSHDLRQPLRSMDGFSKVLLERHADTLDDQARHYLERIRNGAQRMGALIDGLLVLSRVSRKELCRQPVDLSDLADAVVARLREAEPRRDVVVSIEPGLWAAGDVQLIESVLENLLGNAWKFSGQRSEARIEVGVQTRDDDRTEFFVRDNGAGFDMRYADKLFGPFQRLHTEGEFEGTGIGLATVQRIIHRHGGRIRAEGAVDEGATFFFTLCAKGVDG